MEEETRDRPGGAPGTQAPGRAHDQTGARETWDIVAKKVLLDMFFLEASINPTRELKEDIPNCTYYPQLGI